MVQKQTAAIYCRVSTDDQDCDRQIRDLTKFADKRGFRIVSVHRETASGAKADRPERAKVMKLAKAGKIDAILCTELSRWGRSTSDVLDTLKELETAKVSFVPQNSNFQIEMSSPMGKLVTTMFAALAEMERDLIIERTRSGLAAAKARGVKLGRRFGHNPSDKYKDKVLTMIDAGKPYREIAEKLKISKTTVVEMVKRYGPGTAMKRGRKASCAK